MLLLALLLVLRASTRRASAPSQSPVVRRCGQSEGVRAPFWAKDEWANRVSLAPSKGNPLWQLSVQDGALGAVLPASEDWDLILDARSPGEFGEDHLPGAVNAAVLDDEERARVGTVYQADSFEAKKVGAGFVAKNLAKILQRQEIQTLPQDATVLVYCYRGGERSGSLAQTLARVGWRVCVLQGGYKAYRGAVRELLARQIEKLQCVVIAGRTGSAKGLLLRMMEKQGAQVVDLEEVAKHRGSTLGALPGVQQPTQKFFETLLLQELLSKDLSRPIFLESESARVGVITLPAVLYRKMKEAPVVDVRMPLAERVKWIRSGYRHFETTHVPELRKQLQAFVPSVGKKTVAALERCIEDQRWEEAVTRILVEHYDPAYSRAFKDWEHMDSPTMTIDIARAEEEEMSQAASAILSRFQDTLGEPEH